MLTGMSGNVRRKTRPPPCRQRASQGLNQARLAGAFSDSGRLSRGENPSRARPTHPAPMHSISHGNPASDDKRRPARFRPQDEVRERKPRCRSGES